MKRSNWFIRIYKPYKNPNLWQYSVYRICRGTGLEEYLSESGKWSIASLGIKRFQTEQEAKEFATANVGPEYTEV